MKLNIKPIMYYQLYLFPLNYIWVMECSHIASNNSDVIITYAGHSDLDRPVPKPAQETVTRIEKPRTEAKNEAPTEATSVYDDETEGVVFIPNDTPMVRNEDKFFDDGLKVSDLVEQKRVGDLMRGGKVNIAESESPKEDILFISGKNNDNVEKPSQAIPSKKREKQDSKISRTLKATKTKRLNCSNLDCNNTVNAVCGSKEENKQVKYRLFMNECFFRKVNCGFQYATNRYDLVPLEKCKNTGAHYITRPYPFKPIPVPVEQKISDIETRRSFSSRRSLNMGVDGSLCAHACPVSCTEDYDPQCAVSGNGRRRVFLNHCKLDYNSCFYKVVWHRRPLSECVGGRKADMTQNRGFIGWMQRVGIVDKKGKLVLS